MELQLCSFSQDQLQNLTDWSSILKGFTSCFWRRSLSMNKNITSLESWKLLPRQQGRGQSCSPSERQLQRYSNSAESTDCPYECVLGVQSAKCTFSHRQLCFPQCSVSLSASDSHLEVKATGVPMKRTAALIEFMVSHDCGKHFG